MSVHEDSPDWPRLPGGVFGVALMSNYDGEVNREVEAQLRAGHFLAKYPGWDFNGDCWFAEGKFHCAVYAYHVHRFTVVGDTPEEIMAQVREVYGTD